MNMHNEITPEDIINFWFNELKPEQWWKVDLQLDFLIRDRFEEVHKKGSANELKDWRKTALGSLAEIIVLDQFSRNIFRGTAKAFTCDDLALDLAKEAVNKGFDQELSIVQRPFLYMPYMHSESVQVHEEAMILFAQKGLENSLEFEILHKRIIDQFGRYPHRNKILGRVSTPEEIEFLKTPNSSF